MTNKPVSSSEYNRDYYQKDCQGYEEFTTSRGAVLPARLAIPFEAAAIQPGMRVLDVGCGRGEVVLNAVKRGAQVWGIDYAADAVKIAQETLREVLPDDLKPQAKVGQCDTKSLPFASNSIDRVFMLDVVEHLYPDELRTAFAEVRRVLAPGGRLVIHTMPSLWYYWYGYPFYRLIQRLRGEILPANPRERFPYGHLHVNEQTPTRLKRMLAACGLRSRVWLRPTQNYGYEGNSFVRFGMQFLTSVYPFRWVFCNDIFAIATKED